VTVSAKRDRTGAEHEARASERKPGPTTPDQKTMRTTLRKSRGSFEPLEPPSFAPGQGDLK